MNGAKLFLTVLRNVLVQRVGQVGNVVLTHITPTERCGKVVRIEIGVRERRSKRISLKFVLFQDLQYT